MADWGPVLIAVVLFVLLTPGLLFQLPGNSRVVEFNNMQTSGVSILVHTIIYFALITVFLIAIGVHIYTGGGDQLPSPSSSAVCCCFLLCCRLHPSVWLRNQSATFLIPIYINSIFLRATKLIVLHCLSFLYVKFKQNLIRSVCTFFFFGNWSVCT